MAKPSVRERRRKPENDKRRSPEHIAHLKQIGRQKGEASRGGGRKALPQEVKDAMSSKSLEAVELLADMMYNSTNENVRLRAAAFFVEAFVSKAPTQSEVKVNHSHSIADMLAEINQMRLSDNSKTIDITPAEEPEKRPFIEGEFSDV